MFNSYSETLAAGVAMLMVVVAAHWLWEQLLTQLAQHGI